MTREFTDKLLAIKTIIKTIHQIICKSLTFVLYKSVPVYFLPLGTKATATLNHINC